MNTRSFGYLIFVSILFICLVTLSGCNSESSESSNNANYQSGNVAVLLTDGPTDEFNEVNVTITEIKLLNDDGQVSIFQGSETVNLLDLTSHSNLFSFVDNVPVGTYDKIRLMVSDVSLVRYNGQGSDAYFIDENDDEIFYPKQTGNGKIDLNPQGDFEVVSGETLYLQLDMDAKKSILINETGNGKFIFRPVVFVDVVSHDLHGKLVRLSGTVMDLDEDHFYLCDTGMDYSPHEDDDDNSDDFGSAHLDIDDDDNQHSKCVKITTNPGTSYFTATGMPSDFGGLAENEPATVLGHFKVADDDDHHLMLDADVIELATGDIYQRFGGEVTSDASNNSFELLLDTGQSISATDPILVELIDGAKVYSMSGDELSISNITTGRIAKVEGIVVLSDTDPDKIMAAVVFLGEMADSVTMLSGNVTTTYVDQNYFDMTDDVLGNRCVNTDGSTDIYGLTIDGSSITSTPIALGDLIDNQHVDVYGNSWVNGCLLADQVLATMP
jgi:hypothetical protein